MEENGVVQVEHYQKLTSPSPSPNQSPSPKSLRVKSKKEKENFDSRLPLKSHGQQLTDTAGKDSVCGYNQWLG